MYANLTKEKWIKVGYPQTYFIAWKKRRPLSGHKKITRFQEAVKSWDTNWTELSTYFKYPKEVRTLIYIQCGWGIPPDASIQEISKK